MVWLSAHELLDLDLRHEAKFRTRRHGLHQADLPEVGSQGVVSELLSGKRRLNARQLKTLAERFGVNPGVFL